MRCRVDFNFWEWWRLKPPWERKGRYELGMLETDEVVEQGESLTSADRSDPADTEVAVDGDRVLMAQTPRYDR